MYRLALARLLTEAPPDLPNGHCSIYVCHLCGDIERGGVSAKIERQDDTVIWSSFNEFGFAEDFVCEPITTLGSLEFDKTQYDRECKKNYYPSFEQE